MNIPRTSSNSNHIGTNLCSTQFRMERNYKRTDGRLLNETSHSPQPYGGLAQESPPRCLTTGTPSLGWTIRAYYQNTLYNWPLLRVLLIISPHSILGPYTLILYKEFMTITSRILLTYSLEGKIFFSLELVRTLSIWNYIFFFVYHYLIFVIINAVYIKIMT